VIGAQLDLHSLTTRRNARVPILGSMWLAEVILVTWLLVAVVLLVLWARHNALARFRDGIDEDAYIEGREECPAESRRGA